MLRMSWRGPRIAAGAEKAAMDALYEAGEAAVLARSNQLVPHDLGDLEGSGEVSRDDFRGRVNVSYDRPYAAEQHENLEFKHKAGREAKYLEKALNQMAGRVRAYVATACKRALGG